MGFGSRVTSTLITQFGPLNLLSFLLHRLIHERLICIEHTNGSLVFGFCWLQLIVGIDRKTGNVRP